MVTRDQLAGNTFEISEAKFKELFIPIANPARSSSYGLDQYIFEDHKNAPNCRVWTLICEKGGKETIKSGRHFHDSSGYIICRNSLQDGITVNVVLSTWLKIHTSEGTFDLLDKSDLVDLINDHGLEGNYWDYYDVLPQPKWRCKKTKTNYWELNTINEFIEEEIEQQEYERENDRGCERENE